MSLKRYEFCRDVDPTAPTPSPSLIPRRGKREHSTNNEK